MRKIPHRHERVNYEEVERVQRANVVQNVRIASDQAQ